MKLTTGEILDRVLMPFTECLTSQAAKQILDFRADEQTQSCINQLAKKANSGLITDDERALYEDYINAFDLVAILKSKARSVLAQRDA